MKYISKIFAAAIVILSSCTSATDPNQLINHKASLPQTFKLSDLHQKVITTFISNSQHTTSILYGNEKACTAASTAFQVKSAGESFTLVTWRQQDDQHWFGARIPGDLIAAETLALTGTDNVPVYHYQKFYGKELIKLADTTGNTKRIHFILSQKASIIP